MEKSKIRQHLEAKSKKGVWKQHFKDFKENQAWRKHSSTIALAVLAFLEDKNLSQKDLAERLGYSPQRLNKLLKGGENLTLKTICELEEATGLRLLRSFGYEEQGVEHAKFLSTVKFSSSEKKLFGQVFVESTSMESMKELSKIIIRESKDGLFAYTHYRGKKDTQETASSSNPPKA